MRPADTVELCQAVNELNARRMAAVQRRVHAFLGLLLAIAVGLALAFALIHLSTLCKGASLCMFAVLPTQRNWLQRLVLDLQRWRLLRQLRHAQQDLVFQRESLDLATWECKHLPRQLAVTRAHIDGLMSKMDALAAPAER
jgi:hypothetical protein